MKNLTLEDIAKMAGVSRATVSRVINNQVGARSKTRGRVLQVIAETGFQPHAAARSLASQRSNVIGLIMPMPANEILSQPYLLQLAEAISRACHEVDYILSLFLTGSGTDEQKLLPKITCKGFVDGLIVRVTDTHNSASLLEKLVEIGIPFVATGHLTDPQQTSYVVVDNVTAAYKAVTHLLDLGRRRIAMIAGSMESYPSLERLKGYRQALSAQGLAGDDRLITVGEYTKSGGYYAACRLLDHKPDAIFAATDNMAVGVLQALHEAGIRVPDDIAVVGFDDISLAREADPPLTTMRQPLTVMGKRLVEILFDIMETGLDPPRQVIFEAELVIRKSCGAANPATG